MVFEITTIKFMSSICDVFGRTEPRTMMFFSDVTLVNEAIYKNYTMIHREVIT